MGNVASKLPARQIPRLLSYSLSVRSLGVVFATLRNLACLINEIVVSDTAPTKGLVVCVHDFKCVVRGVSQRVCVATSNVVNN